MVCTLATTMRHSLHVELAADTFMTKYFPTNTIHTVSQHPCRKIGQHDGDFSFPLSYQIHWIQWRFSLTSLDHSEDHHTITRIYVFMWWPITTSNTMNFPSCLTRPAWYVSIASWRRSALVRGSRSGISFLWYEILSKARIVIENPAIHKMGNVQVYATIFSPRASHGKHLGDSTHHTMPSPFHIDDYQNSQLGGRNSDDAQVISLNLQFSVRLKQLLLLIKTFDRRLEQWIFLRPLHLSMFEFSTWEWGDSLMEGVKTLSSMNLRVLTKDRLRHPELLCSRISHKKLWEYTLTGDWGHEGSNCRVIQGADRNPSI